MESGWRWLKFDVTGGKKMGLALFIGSLFKYLCQYSQEAAQALGDKNGSFPPEPVTTKKILDLLQMFDSG